MQAKSKNELVKASGVNSIRRNKQVPTDVESQRTMDSRGRPNIRGSDTSSMKKPAN